MVFCFSLQVLTSYIPRLQIVLDSNLLTMPFFGKSTKSPQELVKSLRDGLVALTRETGEKKLDKVKKVKQ